MTTRIPLPLPSLRPGCWWAAAGTATGGVLFVVLFVVAGATRASENVPAPSPVVTVLSVPTATSTPVVIPTTTPEPSPTPAPTSDPNTVLSFQPGDLVQVFGTGGDGLRLRSSPDLDAQVNLLGLESEVFEVSSAPQQADGYFWVYLVNPFDSAENGWAVANFLRPVGSQ